MLISRQFFPPHLLTTRKIFQRETQRETERGRGEEGGEGLASNLVLTRQRKGGRESKGGGG